MSNKKIDQFERERNRERRAFLSMLGRIGVSAPLLRTAPLVAGVFANRFAEAQTTGRKKFISIYHPNGTLYGDTSGFITGPAKQVYANIPGVAMRTAMISDPGGHGNIARSAGRLEWSGNQPSNSTIDVQMGKVLQAGTPSPYYSFGVRMDHLGTNLNDVCSINNGVQSDVGRGPIGALSKIFSGAPPVNNGGVQTGPTQFDMRRAVLDANRLLLNKYKNKFGQDEKEKIDTHLGAIEELEKRLDFDEQLATDPSPAPGGGSCSAAQNYASNSQLTPLGEYKGVAEVAVLALSCGLTNSISIQFNETQATWLPNTPGDPDAVTGLQGDHHGANHGGGQALIPQCVAYMHKGVAHLIQKLQAANLYQDTVIVVYSEMGQGVDHTPVHGPIVIASGSGVTSSARATTSQHTAAFNDAARLLGLSSRIGSGLHDYRTGSLL
jgi:hypothetical protein